MYSTSEGNMISSSPTTPGNLPEIAQAFASFASDCGVNWQWWTTLTFRDCPSNETAKKAFDKWTHMQNRKAFGCRYTKDKAKGLVWIAGMEYQKRGAPHFHVIQGNVPEWMNTPDHRKIARDAWYDMAGIGQIWEFEKNKGAEFYLAKSSYTFKRGEIDVSDNLKFHVDDSIIGARLLES